LIEACNNHAWQEDPNEGRAFIVKTKKNSLHRGKVFFLRNKTPENAKLWIEKASTARVSFFARHESLNKHQQLPISDHEPPPFSGPNQSGDAPMVVGNVSLFNLFCNDFLV
jgi:hypothetical protein